MRQRVRAGNWEKYLPEGTQEAEEFAVSICYAYLNGDSGTRRAIESEITHGDVLWFFEQFLRQRIEAIAVGPSAEALILGLTVVAIIGRESDFRDVDLWCHELYSAAKDANLQEIEPLFARVSSLASDVPYDAPWGSPSVAIAIGDIECLKRSYEHQQKVIRDHANAALDDRYDTSGLTPLMQAALKGDVPRIIDLIKAGADVNAVAPGPGAGHSALAFAAFANKKEAVDALLEAGASVDIHPPGFLIRFAELGNADPYILDRLRKSGSR